MTPDAWQLDALRAFADPMKPRISLQACAGGLPEGPKGEKGPRGVSGSAGRLFRGGRVELLAVVESQIEDIHHELDLQMKRIAQLQQQVDELCAEFRALASDVSTSLRNHSPQPLS